MEIHPAFSANDCFCLVTALARFGTPLTGDAQLRKAATRHGLCVHGVLWIVDELDSAAACPAAMLRTALAAGQGGTAVFLPSRGSRNA